MYIGNTILELRKQKHMTQEELAAQLGVTAAAVSKWENNYTLPDILILCALADLFDVTTDTHLGRTAADIDATPPEIYSIHIIGETDEDILRGFEGLSNNLHLFPK